MALTSTTEPSAMEESQNWPEMPHDVMINILQRLGIMEILKTSRKVCRTWRRVCKDPGMWTAIVMHKPYDRRDEWDDDYVLKTLTKQAVDLSGGELIDISIDSFGNDDLLDHIVLHSSKLKRLHLISCWAISGSALSRAVKRVPHLEKIEITYTIIEAEEIEVIGRSCPQLKTFIVANRFRGKFSRNRDDFALAIANNMPELHHLGLFGGDMTNNGLEAILNGCPHLQSLDVRKCRNIFLGGQLGKLCKERIKDFKCNLF